MRFEPVLSVRDPQPNPASQVTNPLPQPNPAEILLEYGVQPDAHQMQAAFVERWPKSTKATRGCVMALAEVARNGCHRTMERIAAEMGVSSETVHKTAHRLEQIGWLRITGGEWRHWRDPNDPKRTIHRRRPLSYERCWGRGGRLGRFEQALVAGITEARAAGVPENVIRQRARNRQLAQLRSQAATALRRGVAKGGKYRESDLGEDADQVQLGGGANGTRQGWENKYSRSVSKESGIGSDSGLWKITTPSKISPERAELLNLARGIQDNAPWSTASMVLDSRGPDWAAATTASPRVRIDLYRAAIAQSARRLKAGRKGITNPAGLVAARYRALLNAWGLGQLDASYEPKAQPKAGPQVFEGVDWTAETKEPTPEYRWQCGGHHLPGEVCNATSH